MLTGFVDFQVKEQFQVFLWIFEARKPSSHLQLRALLCWEGKTGSATHRRFEVDNFYLCMLCATSVCLLILWSGPSISFLLPNHSRKFQTLRKTAVLTWYWDCDLRTPVPSAKDTHHAVLQVSFLCLWVYYRAALL